MREITLPSISQLRNPQENSSETESERGARPVGAPRVNGCSMRGREGPCAGAFRGTKTRTGSERNSRDRRELESRVHTTNRTCQPRGGWEWNSVSNTKRSFGPGRSCSNGPVWSWNPYVGCPNSNRPRILGLEVTPEHRTMSSSKLMSQVEHAM